eukprot:CAMPEP_0194082342 /NCGR_PEP_ID=MMETSP0149-20130528/7876_1 /TAXON_ID=122233 /ORGANISM="Chaetoceros debilis, Strain MM31A-1" /LENGTH=681 /DNA_ID=CAMNT_0038764479 /DNA_START=56 /DNA_END=2101 /DNA_ORIENTATION=+
MQDNWSSTSASSTAPSTPTQRKKRVPLIRRFLVLLIVLASFLLFCLAQIFNPYLIPALDRIVISRAPFNICHEKYSYSQDANGEQGMGHKRRRGKNGENKTGSYPALTYSNAFLWNVSRMIMMAYSNISWGMARIYMRGDKDGSTLSTFSGNQNGNTKDGDEMLCDLCQMYQRFRCHFRADKIHLNRVYWWDHAKLSNVKIRSSDACSVKSESNFGARSSPLFELSHVFPFHLLRTSTPTSIDDGTSMDGSCTVTGMSKYDFDFIRHHPDDPNLKTGMMIPSAIEISDLSLEWGTVHKPVVNINATNITINVVYGKEKMNIDSFGFDFDFGRSRPGDNNSGVGGDNKIEFPVETPYLKIGDWSLHELVAMLPDPPEAEGLYPRLGTVNITDVTIIIHDYSSSSFSRDQANGNAKVEGSYFDTTHPTKVYNLPNELFLPLLLYTTEASRGLGDENNEKGGASINIDADIDNSSSKSFGIDQTIIANIIRKSAIVAARKHFLGKNSDDAIVDVIRKFTDFTNTVDDLLKIGDDVIDQHLVEMKKFRSDMEYGWAKAILSNQEKFLKFWEGWEQWKDSLISDHFSSSDSNLNHLVPASLLLLIGEIFKQTEAEVKKAWREHAWKHVDQFGEQIEKFVESGLRMAKQIEEDAEQAWNDVENLIENGMNVAKLRLRDYVKGKIKSS